MPLADDDLDIFFSNSDVAKTATYTPAVGTAKPVQVIFDAPFGLTSAQGIDYQSDVPAVTIKTSDVPSVGEGDTLTIDGVVFKVKEIQPDGTGISRIILSKD